MYYPAPDPSDERKWLEIEEEAGHWWLRSGIWAPEPLNDVDDRFVTIC
jgi:hypothetical protein